MVKKDMKKPGSGWGTGRPSTGRTHPVTVRLSDYSFGILTQVSSKIVGRAHRHTMYNA